MIFINLYKMDISRQINPLVLNEVNRLAKGNVQLHSRLMHIAKYTALSAIEIEKILDMLRDDACRFTVYSMEDAEEKTVDEILIDMRRQVNQLCDLKQQSVQIPNYTNTQQPTEEEIQKIMRDIRAMRLASCWPA